MKKYRILTIITILITAITALAQNTSINDSTIIAIKVKEINIKKTSLQKQISIEDAKRGRNIEGVTPERQEILNDKQDSICLELRSQLIDIELELNEIVPDQTVGKIVNQFNILNQNQQQNSHSTNDIIPQKETNHK